MVKEADGKVLLELIEKNDFVDPFDIRIAEIGVYEGHTTEYLLERLSYVNEYWAIDQWSVEGMRRQGKTFGEITEREWLIKYQKVASLMLKFSQLRVLKMDSVKSAYIFPKHYFDLVFIDASHIYEDVIQDIKCWFPLVAFGGVITGHDYGVGRHKGVKQAVDEIFGALNVKVLDESVWVYKKEKIDGRIKNQKSGNELYNGKGL